MCGRWLVSICLLAVSDSSLVAETRSTTVGAVDGTPPAEPTDDPGRADEDRKQICENKAVVVGHAEDVGAFERFVDPEPHDAQQQERCHPPGVAPPAPAQGGEHGRRQGEGD
jgi:hypothetical protein